MAKNDINVVAFIDLLGNKASAHNSAVSPDDRYDAVLFNFYTLLVKKLNAESDQAVRVRIFGDSAYVFLQQFDQKVARKLSLLRTALFDRGVFFKCAIVLGNYEPTSAQEVRSELQKHPQRYANRNDLIVRVVRNLDQWVNNGHGGGPKFWENFQLTHFGRSSTTAYFAHENFKGWGFDVSAEIAKIKGLERCFVSSAFPSAVTGEGFRRFYDLRYPRENCNELFYTEDQDSADALLRSLSSLNQLAEDRELITLHWPPDQTYHIPDLDRRPDNGAFGFVRKVIEAMRTASIRKREYAVYYSSVLVSIINTSNFSYLYANNTDDAKGWSFFPEVFYELLLQDGVIDALIKIDSFELVLASLMKRMAEEKLIRDAALRSLNDKISDDIEDPDALEALSSVTFTRFMELLARIPGITELVNGRVASIFTEKELRLLQVNLAEVLSPYHNKM